MKRKIETIVISDSEDEAEQKSPAVPGSGAGATGSSKTLSAKPPSERLPTTKKPKRKDVPTPPPARARVPFPPEVLINIIFEVSCIEEDYPGQPDAERHSERNALLAPLAGVSHQFQAATYSVLYGDLRLRWEPKIVALLARSCSRNGTLAKVVHRLEASATSTKDREQFIEEMIDSYVEDEDRQREYFAELHGDEDDDWTRGFSEDEEREWREELQEEAEEEWSTCGWNVWHNAADTTGITELLDLLAQTANLQTLVVRGFDSDNAPEDLLDDIDSRLPYTSITSLSTPDDFPLLSTHTTLAAWLVTRMPRLRRLRGGVGGPNSRAVPSPLPPLTHLDLSHLDDDYIKTTTSQFALEGILKPVRKSLQSLRLRGTGWPVLAYRLTALERLTLESSYYKPDKSRVDYTLPPSPLRHLELDIHARAGHLPSAMLDVLATLPTTLESVTLRKTEVKDSIEYATDFFSRVQPDSSPEEHLEQILQAVKRSRTRPLCIIMSIGSERKRDKVLKKFARKFAAEGLGLGVLVDSSLSDE